MSTFDGLEAATYRGLVIDPPWPYDTRPRPTGHALARVEAGMHYSLMTMAELEALPVADLAHPDGAVLWCWTTNRHLVDGRASALVSAWGFTPKTLVTWAKSGQPGVGRWARTNTEHVIVATIGHPALPDPPLPASCFSWVRPSGGVSFSHSRKPAAFADLVEAHTEGPFVELFARQGRFGWDSWGLGVEVPA